MFAFLAAHRRELFPDDAFADLFASQNGRPSLPADVIASVMVLQTLHNLSDREAAEALTYDLRWKAACGFALTETSFHPTVLVYWRKRLAASDRPHRIFEAVMEASPYDLSDWGYAPVEVETPAGKAEYVRRQRGFTERSNVLRDRVVSLLA